MASPLTKPVCYSMTKSACLSLDDYNPSLLKQPKQKQKNTSRNL